MQLRQLVLPLTLSFLAAGCATPGDQPAPATRSLGSEAERSDRASNRVLEKAGFEPDRKPGARVDRDIEATHHARHFYLQGVRLLTTKPIQIDQAIREFQLALERDTLFYKAHFKLGYAYYHKGQYNLEIAEYKKCLVLKNDYEPAWLNLGHAYLAMDRLEEARNAYRKVIEHNPGHAIAQYNLGLVEFDLDEFEESARHLEAFLHLPTPKGPMAEQARQCLERIQERLETKK